MGDKDSRTDGGLDFYYSVTMIVMDDGWDVVNWHFQTKYVYFDARDLLSDTGPSFQGVP